MDYTQLTEADVKRMLAAIGVAGVEDLFRDIPPQARLRRPLDLPGGLDEPALLEELQRLASANRPAAGSACFLGAGCYDHFIPSVVDALAGQSEFVTAYTPYQAEASQGSLQAFYEYQTMICQLTGMDVSNASLYEGATAAAEAVLMARAATGRRRVAVSRAVHPHTREVLATYLRELPVETVVVPAPDGTTDLQALASSLDEQTAAVLVQSPNFFGCPERLDLAAGAVRRVGGLLIASVDPISCGLLKTPGELGADIVVGDAQPLGIPMSWGGPSLGFMACRESLMRRMPGRLIGATRDRSGRRAYCLTLQTREQHIRRERATSNICTNQGLLALRVSIYLAAMGPRGLQTVARLCLDKAHQAARRIAALPGFRLRFAAPFLREFVVQAPGDPARLLQHARDRGILAGVPLGAWFPELADCFLVALTEKRTAAQIDALAAVLREAAGGMSPAVGGGGPDRWVTTSS